MLIIATLLLNLESNRKITVNWFRSEKKPKDGHMDFYIQRGCQQKFIYCPRGSLVLWDSRLIHCGVPPMKWRALPNFRCVVYLCYQPRSGATANELKKKRAAFENMRMTTHWPCKSKLFAEGFRTYDKEVKPVEPLPTPALNELGIRLTGL
jgi:hypothetical protein